MNFAKYTDHAIPFFIDGNTLPISMLYFKSVAILMHDIANNAAPPNITNLFQLSSQIHQHYTRFSSQQNYAIKYSRLQKQKNSFSRTATNIWNSIPLTIRSLSKYSFKRKVHETLIKILQQEDEYVDIITLMKKFNLENQ